ncbi:MAG: 4Fe-4S dicluster domain-containing protein [Oscillospiraceae bacterium]|nr:4Fe-4S dicluster domain-containing protein [Oscillospiraceae bacterium]
MGKLGFYYDATYCTGCKTCQIACKDKNRLDIGTIFRAVKDYEIGEYPNASIYHISMSCNHCEHPACVAVCPVGAMYVAEDGTVIHDDDMCIGCKACVAACPYGAPKFVEAKNIVQKCDACAAIRAAGGNPVCVDACPMRVLEFGDLDELAAKHAGENLVKDLPVLPSSETTNPSILIKVKDSMLLEGAEEAYL